MSKINEDILELTESILAVQDKMEEITADMQSCPHCDCGHKLGQIELLKAHNKSLQEIRLNLEIKGKL